MAKIVQRLPTSFIFYLDANNLYGWAQSESLPTGSFEWVTEEELSQISVDQIPDDASWGYFLEVNITYPQSLHDAHHDLSFCPKTVAVPDSSQKELLTTLFDKQNYVAHYRVLKQPMQASLIITKYRRELRFG